MERGGAVNQRIKYMLYTQIPLHHPLIDKLVDYWEVVAPSYIMQLRIGEYLLFEVWNIDEADWYRRMLFHEV